MKALVSCELSLQLKMKNNELRVKTLDNANNVFLMIQKGLMLMIVVKVSNHFFTKLTLNAFIKQFVSTTTFYNKFI